MNIIWKSLEKRPLSEDIKNLPTIVAEPWVKVGEGHKRPRLEGMSFDRYGNLYYCYRHYPGASVMRVTPDKRIEEIYTDRSANACFVGTAVHKDGRIFTADIDGHRLLVLTSSGKIECDLFESFPDKVFDPNDLCFDKKGNLYFTDFKGTAFNPTGGVYRLDSSEDYRQLHIVIDGLSAPNGIAFTPDETKLWISETSKNEVFKLRVTPDGNMMDFPFAQTSFYRATGYEMFDSLKVDKNDNCYVAVMYGGRVLILNTYGVPIGNVLIPGREEEKSMMSPNVAIRPGTNEGYICSSGEQDAWIYKFETIAEADSLFSFL